MSEKHDLFFPEAFDDSDQGPLYLQLSRRIHEAINSGHLNPGDSLPPEREIASRCGLSRVTIRKAIAELVMSGQLIQRRGSGTFVAPRVERLEQALSLLTSFTEDMARRGRNATSQWLVRGVFAPSPEEIMALGLGVKERVSRLERVRCSDGLPLAIEQATLPVHFLPDPLCVTHSLYEVLESWDLRPVRAVQRLSATNLNVRDAGLLQVATGQAGLKIERLSYLQNGQVIEFTRSLYRGDAYDFAVELKLNPNTGRTAE